jgi:ParB-like chromosome segregation protein Spo0J
VKIQMWSADKVLPYKKNPRRNDDAVEQVAASIREFGFKQPIVVDKDSVIIVGHTRLLAALRLGMKEVQVLVAADVGREILRASRRALGGRRRMLARVPRGIRVLDPAGVQPRGRRRSPAAGQRIG